MQMQAASEPFGLYHDSIISISGANCAPNEPVTEVEIGLSPYKAGVLGYLINYLGEHPA